MVATWCTRKHWYDAVLQCIDVKLTDRKGTLPSLAPTNLEAQPFLVLSPLNNNLSRPEILNSVKHFASSDDVFSADFLTDFIGVQEGVKLDECTHSLLGMDTAVGKWDIKAIHDISVEGEPLPAGPYFLQGNSIHQAWKCYADDLDAFSVAVYPRDVRAADTTLGFLGDYFVPH